LPADDRLPKDNGAESSSGSVSDDADALYAQGMAHYRRREWKEARGCFIRLKALAPDRRGVDALLNEIDIFIQLQEMQPQERPRQSSVSRRRAVPSAQSVEATVTRAQAKVPRKRTWLWILAAVVVVVVLGVALYSSGALAGILDQQRQARVQALVNQGRAAMNVGDYGRAVTAFEEALALAPNNEDVKTWYAKARRYQELAVLYQEAEAAIAAGQWETALEKLQQITALDPTYEDAREKAEEVKRKQALEQRYAEATALVANENWDQVIAVLQQLKGEDASFRASDVSQLLFDAFLRKGLSLLTGAADSPAQIALAIDALDSALEASPSDPRALEERRLAGLYRQAYLSVNQEDWPQAVVTLRDIYTARPEYMDGRVGSLLCMAHLRLGDAFRSAGDLVQALEQYRSVLEIDGCDHVEAAVKEREVYSILYPPTATPTITLTATRTPLPTPTPTASPTAAVVPTSVPPPPPPTSIPPTPTPPR